VVIGKTDRAVVADGAKAIVLAFVDEILVSI
jgi:hypothetical protein